MIIEYFADTDTLYIGLSKGVSPESEEVKEDVIFDYNEKGQVKGVTIEHASALTDLGQLEVRGLSIRDLLVKENLPAIPQD